jgi:mRNA-degrading endonuclease toxin of MazEF toxin-antitoxin module
MTNSLDLKNFRFHQGDIIKVDPNPTQGTEKSGYRPAVILWTAYSDKAAGTKSLVALISNSIREHPLHVLLPEGEDVTGMVYLEDTRSLDLSARQHRVVGHLSQDTLDVLVDRCVSMFKA